MKPDGRKVDHATLQEIRFAVVRAVQEGATPSEAARSRGVDGRRAFEWLARYRAGGWEALRSRKASGRPRRLEGRQIRWIYRTVTRKSPLQRKLPSALWTRAQIRRLIWRQFALQLSVTSVGRLLAQLGLTCRRPLLQACRQDAPLVEQWLKQEYPKIRALARRQHAEVFFQEESGIRSDFPGGTIRAPRGRRPVVRVRGRSLPLIMISATSARGAVHFQVIRGAVDASAFLRFLKHLIYRRRRPVFLIVDGRPSHRAKLVTRYVESLEGRLRLFFLPPDSPGLNPDEHVCRHISNRTVGRRVVHDAKALARRIKAQLRRCKRTPELVRALFHAAEARHAATLQPACSALLSAG